jgi:hypothetical protein
MDFSFTGVDFSYNSDYICTFTIKIHNLIDFHRFQTTRGDSRRPLSTRRYSPSYYPIIVISASVGSGRDESIESISAGTYRIHKIITVQPMQVRIGKAHCFGFRWRRTSFPGYIDLMFLWEGREKLHSFAANVARHRTK